MSEFTVGQEVLVTPPVGVGESRDTEPGLQPWKAIVVGWTDEKVLVESDYHTDGFRPLPREIVSAIPVKPETKYTAYVSPSSGELTCTVVRDSPAGVSGPCATPFHADDKTIREIGQELASRGYLTGEWLCHNGANGLILTSELEKIR